MILRKYAARFLNLPLLYRLLLTFLPLIFVSVTVIGVTTYSIAKRQLFENAQELLGATVEQTAFVLNEKCMMYRTELAAVETSATFQRMVAHAYEKKDSDQYYTDIIKMNQLFSTLLQQGPHGIDSLYLKLNTGQEFSSIQGYAAVCRGINLAECFSRVPVSATGWQWLTMHPDELFYAAEPRQVVTVFHKIGSSKTQTSGILLMNIAASNFSSILDAVHLTTGSYLLVSGPDGTMYSAGYQPEYAVGQNGFSVFSTYRGRKGSFHITGSDGRKKMIVVFAPVAVSGWTIAAVAPESNLLAHSVLLRRILFIAISILTLITGLLVTIFSATITRPIRHLSDQVQLVHSGSFDILFDIPQTNELGILARGLTDLEKKVRLLFSRIREEQEKKRKAELAAMQAQIRPHFLYNTLSSIKYLCDMNRNEDASRMTEALTKFYMGSLSGGREVIPLEDEIEQVRNYIIIQKMRYKDLVGIEFTVQPEASRAEILKLTLQPLVENAIYHGIKPARRRGYISVTAEKKDDLLVLKISDDGAGMNSTRLEDIRASLQNDTPLESNCGIGLRNVRQRIRLHYGTAYGLSIDSTEHTGTLITIRLPFRETDNDRSDS